jgi:hypothetical protein
MTAKQLEEAIQAARRNDSIQHSAAAQHRFLKSIKASCKNMPHSNEAADEARKVYFAYLMKFGLPAIFLTVTPDDMRSFRIVVYSMARVEKMEANYCPTDFSEEDILADFKFRQEVRSDFPGLCAEEYGRIVNLVIKHLFNWDCQEQKANGMGLFGEVLAWCLATEEQARKTLHGHFLLFVKDWKQVLDVLHKRRADGLECNGGLTHQDAVFLAKRFHTNACSAQLFSDFHDEKVLGSHHVFQHECNFRSKRSIARDRRHYQISSVDDQAMRDMRHKQHCHMHNGKIATCDRCQQDFTVNGIIQNALRIHYPSSAKDNDFCFPDTDKNKRLHKLVYELQKSFDWLDDDNADAELYLAKRYFASNALVNAHRVTHANRCFKKGAECYANIPAAGSPCTNILYCDPEEFDIWSDCWGNKEKRWMFRFEPKRFTEDAFMNVHNPTVTQLVGCNNNVMVGMNGRCVFYCTCYNCKKTQKEERQSFERVSDVLIKVLQNQVSEMEIMS